MSIDPRTMSALLKLQFAPNLDFQAASPNVMDAAPDEGGASLFDMLLHQYMNGSVAGTLEETAQAPVQPIRTSTLLPALSVGYAVPLAGSLTYGAEASEYEPLIRSAAAKYGVDPSLVRAVMQTESGFRADAVSSAGAKGLMQLMDATARSLGVSDSFDPEQNIEGGTRYLAYLLRKYNGNEQVALAAYNAGPGRIDRLGIDSDAELAEKLHTLPEQTRGYVSKVLNAR